MARAGRPSVLQDAALEIIKASVEEVGGPVSTNMVIDRLKGHTTSRASARQALYQLRAKGLITNPYPQMWALPEG